MNFLYEWNQVSSKYIKVKIIESSILFLSFSLIMMFIYLMKFHVIVNYLIPYILIATLIWFLIHLFTIKFHYKSIAFKVNKSFLIYKSGFVFHKEISIPCQKVYQIKIKQGPVLKKLNLVSLEIITAVDSLEVDFIELATAEKFKNNIEDYGGGNKND